MNRFAPAAGAAGFPLVDYPGISRFAADLVTGAGSARKFAAPYDLAELVPRRRTVPQELVSELQRTNSAWGNDVTTALERWANGETVTLIAGQQVGFGGGPLYTFSKIATLIHVARKLRTEGTDATLFFWMATEDHDFDEVAALCLLSDDGVTRLRSPVRPAGQRPVGTLRIPAELRNALSEALRLEQPEWLDGASSFRDSFARLLAETFAGNHIVLVDSLLPSLRRAGQPLFARLARDFSAIERSVAATSESLHTEGYPPQVTPREGHYSLLYRIAPSGERLPVRKDERGWVIGETAVSDEMIGSLIEQKPEEISTGALARPLLQDFVFAPDLFIGGPAELAYYAQLNGIHEQLAIVEPRLALRGHVLAAPERLLSRFETLSIPIVELARGGDQAALLLEPETASKIAAAGERMERSIELAAAEIASEIGRIEPPLQKGIERSLRKIRYQSGKLVERAQRALARRDARRSELLRQLSVFLFPGGKPQDREIAWLPFWLRYGERFRDAVIEAAEPSSPVVKIVPLR